eukprot:gb/GECG01006584.1/.p1 GENE.gb/GECG01006584.1/~~gb/GECG01006584.1/.p1  ORF type:complete len:255 (+),score=49.43 gb/GECG01006584.1/:1-765(+)
MEGFSENASTTSNGGGGNQGTSEEAHQPHYNEDFWTSAQDAGNNMCPIFGAAHAQASGTGLEPLGIPNFNIGGEGGYLGYSGFDEAFWEDLYANDTPRDFLSSTPNFTPARSPGGELDFSNDAAIGGLERQWQQGQDPMTVRGSTGPAYRAAGAAVQDNAEASSPQANVETRPARSTRGATQKRKQPAATSEGKDDDDADFQHSSHSVRAAAYEAKRKADAEYENEVGVDARGGSQGESSSKSRRKGVSKEEKR